MSTTEPKIVYLLARGADAIAADQCDLPKTRNGFDCIYYWRQSAKDGTWTNPEKNFTVNITPDMRADLAMAFNDREKSGDETPIVMDHKEGAASTLGYVKAVKQDGDWFTELHQYLGRGAADIALRNQVSIGLKPNYQSPTGKKYRFAVQHSAVTPRPTVPGQGDAIPMLLSRVEDDPNLATVPVESSGGDVVSTDLDSNLQKEPEMATDSNMLPCSPAILDALHKQIPGLKDAPVEEKMGRVAQHFQTVHDGLKKLGMGDDCDTAMMMSRVSDRIKTAEDKATAADAKVLELSRTAAAANDEPKLPDDSTLMLLGRAAETEWQGVIASGAVTKAVVDEVKSIFRSNGKLNLLALSRTSPEVDPVEFRLATALRKNKPLDMSQRTGLQMLSRVTPNDDKPEDKKDEPLPFKEMAARAGGAK